MEIPQDKQFREQRMRFRLRWTCEDCGLFDPTDANQSNNKGCAHGYPTERHRSLRYTDPNASLLFCKDFEPV